MIDSHRIVLPLFAKDSWRLETGLFHLHFATLLSEDFRNKTNRRKHIFQIPLKGGLWKQIRSASHLHSRSLEGKIEAEAITLSHFVCFCLEICRGKQRFLCSSGTVSSPSPALLKTESLAPCGYWAWELSLVQMKMSCNCKRHSGFWSLGTKEKSEEERENKLFHTFLYGLSFEVF